MKVMSVKVLKPRKVGRPKKSEAAAFVTQLLDLKQPIVTTRPCKR